MKPSIHTVLLLFAFSPLVADAFVAWPSDTDIISNDSSMLSQMYEDAPTRVVFQVSDKNPDSWRVTLNSVRSTQKALADKKPAIEIVAFGPGIDGLKRGSEWSELVGKALESGIDIMVCDASMAARHYTADDMLPSLKYVPIGAVEIIQKQKEGYYYLRP